MVISLTVNIVHFHIGSFSNCTYSSMRAQLCWVR